MAEFWIEGNASLGGLAYEGEAVVEADLIWENVDYGIGSYEYWGSRERQEDWRTELEEVTITSATIWDDATDSEVQIDLADPANKPLIEYWENYIFETAEPNE
jgi:hypothetical protein